MKILAVLTVSLTVALAMPSGKEVVPPAQVAVKDVAPVLQDQQIQSMVDLEVRTRGGHHCQGFTHDDRCYRFFRGPKRANEAEAFCQQLSRRGHLASITSRHLHEEVLRLISRANGARRTHAWVGGLRYLKTSRFVWLDGSSWSYADWQPGRPKSFSAFDSCVELIENGKFNDRSCGEAQGFICSHPE